MAYGQGSFNGTSFTYESQADHSNALPHEVLTTLSAKKVAFFGANELPVWRVRAGLSLSAYSTLLGLFTAGTSGTLTTEVGHSGTARIVDFAMTENAGPDELSANITFLMT